MVVPLLIIIIFSPKLENRKNNIINKIINIINGWHSIKSNRKAVFIITLFAFLNLIIGTIGSIITYNIIGVNLNFLQAVFLTSVGSLSVLFAITPGGLGITEAIAVFLASVIGITPVESLTATIIGRVAGILVIFVLGPVFSYLLMKELGLKTDTENLKKPKNQK